MKERNTAEDYPYYNDQPATMTLTDWVIVLIALVMGFAALTAAPPRPDWLNGSLYGLIRVILFSLIPLAALYWRAGPAWRARRA